ncbi:ABC transporter substrate binding protein [Pelosinus sp. sgz500959]|uniref:sensor histidine kinase n=1 Tax=Pelosinus sp. sgz500959 TaxID=3242472 RepID=UPI00366EB01C
MKYRVIVSLFVFLILIIPFNNTVRSNSAYTSSKQTYLHEEDKKNILVLNSYHADMPWVQMLERGIKTVFDPYPQIILYFDYMDTKRNIGNEYLENLYNLYTYKYKHKKFDAVIVTDDVAYQFALQHQEELFPSTPIVFCGVNFFSEDQIQGNPWVTGVVEVVDMKKTIELALQLHPQVKRIVVVNDESAVGETNRLLLEKIIPNFSPNIQFSLFQNMSMKEVLEQVAILDQDTLILLMTFNVDKEQAVFSYEESSDLISAHTNIPIYGTWDFYLGHGVVGGMMTSGYLQGQRAADLVYRIIVGGEPSANIPVITESINQYMFDYNDMIKVGLDESKIPRGSMIMNKPASFYDTYKNLVWFLILIFITLLALIIVLAINIRRRKRGEKEILQLNAELETRVLERTKELQSTNDALTNTLVDLQQTRNHLVEFEKMASLGELVAGVAHEINTPIGNSITATSHLEVKTSQINEKFSNGQMKKSDLENYLDASNKVVKIIFTNLERAAQLVHSFKKIAVDQSVEERRQFELGEYMNDVLVSLKPQLKKTKHKVILNCPADIKVYWHPGTLWQIISNLLNNSLVHAYDEDEIGTITIDISHDDGSILLQYSDDGKGMPPEVQKKVFEPFFTTRRGTGGSGLGMHIVYNLVVFKMGGSIECMSKLGVGTVFTVKLPDVMQKQGGNIHG